MKMCLGIVILMMLAVSPAILAQEAPPDPEPQQRILFHSDRDSAAILQAQTTIEHLAIQALNGQVTVYAISDTGEITRLDEVNQIINDALVSLSPAFLQSPSDVAIAPDDTRIAFVVYSLYDSDEVTLLVYSFVDNTVISTSLPGYGNLEWSPTSESILLTPPSSGVFDLVPILRDLYIYDLGQADLTQITDTPTGRYERNIVWIPGTTTIVFSSEYQPCTTSCTGAVENLFAVQTDGTGLQQVTNIDAVLPMAIPYPYSRCSTQDLQWNEDNQRIYFVVSCEDGDRELLLSTTLDGSARIELDLPAIFPADAAVVYSHLQVDDLHLDQLSDRIVVVTSVEPNQLDSHVSIRSLHIYELLDATATEIFTTTVPSQFFISVSELNTLSNSLAIGFLDGTLISGGMLQAIDLTSGTQLQMLETENGVCNLVWLDQNHIVYDQLIEGLCRGVANSVEIWNIQNNEVVETTITNGVQIVQRPEVTILTPTPTPTVTETLTPTATFTPTLTIAPTRSRRSASQQVTCPVWKTNKPHPQYRDINPSPLR